jgi:YesN/AraC family two-component response regulator
VECDGYTQFIGNEKELNILERTKEVGNKHYRSKALEKASFAYEQAMLMAKHFEEETKESFSNFLNKCRQNMANLYLNEKYS